MIVDTTKQTKKFFFSPPNPGVGGKVLMGRYYSKTKNAACVLCVLCDEEKKAKCKRVS